MLPTWTILYRKLAIFWDIFLKIYWNLALNFLKTTEFATRLLIFLQNCENLHPKKRLIPISKLIGYATAIWGDKELHIRRLSLCSNFLHTLRFGVAKFYHFLDHILWDIVFQWWSQSPDSVTKNVCGTWILCVKLLILPPQTLKSWNGLMVANYVGCVPPSLS